MFSFKKSRKDTDNKSKLVERRDREDRRSFKPAQSFPIFDNHGQLIKRDRRIQPDRRISNIAVSYNPFRVSREISKL